jgi:hypothetical protein
MTNKKVKLNLEEMNGNAFAIMGAFSRQAKEENWTADEINDVIDEATSGDHDHLLQTILAHVEEPG